MQGLVRPVQSEVGEITKLKLNAAARPGMARQGQARHGQARHGKVFLLSRMIIRGQARQGTAWRGQARQGFLT